MDKLKEILFGVIVIAALGIIFVPMLFNDEGKKEQIVANMPPKPLVKKPVEPVGNKALAELKENKPNPIESEVASQPVQEEAKKPVVTSTTEVQSMPKEVSKPEVPIETAVPVNSTASVAPATSKSPVSSEVTTTPTGSLSQETKKEVVEPKSNIVVPPPPKTPIEPKKPEDEVAPSHEISTEPHGAQSYSTPQEQESTLEEAPKPSHKAKKKVVKGWVVQVGTFAVHENAVRLTKKLKRDGFPAYSKNVYRHGRNLTLVFVGPHSDQETATETLFAIEAQYGLRGEVLHFSPSGSRIKEDNL